MQYAGAGRRTAKIMENGHVRQNAEGKQPKSFCVGWSDGIGAGAATTYIRGMGEGDSYGR